MGIFNRLFSRKSTDKNTQRTTTAEGSASRVERPVKSSAMSRKSADKNTQKTMTAEGSVSRVERPVKSAAMSGEWRQFFSIVPLHESAKGPLVTFVGTWPEGLDPDVFASSNWPAILRRVRDHLTMPYPRGELSSSSDAPRPDYRMVNGKITRASNPFVDMTLCTVMPADEMLNIAVNDAVDAEPQHIVLRLVERYSELPLAKLVFLLPRMHDASEAATQGKAAVIVIEDMLIQVYKGIENVLFGVYEDLPEGGRLSDKAVEAKLRSLLASSS